MIYKKHVWSGSESSEYCEGERKNKNDGESITKRKERNNV